MLEGAAFASCTSLTNIIISSGVNFIDEATFYGCVNLTSINIPSSVKGIAERVFRGCTSLKSITIPQGVDWIGTGTFSDCTSLRGVYFQGTPPDSFEAFELSYPTIYYLPDATGWGTTFQDRSTELWNPSIQTSHEDFGVVSNRFQFSVSGPTNALVKIESTTNLTEDVWQPAGTYPLNQGAVYYNDPAYTNHPNRYYRLVMPD